ncbi:MAG: PAS domain-containing sensor histidine kinase, partial [Thermodesulfovibrionia bacterium]|nr:PAS domain-containing sensor histidine kinase [Thermodesulfovibrionia bacterium]
HKLAKAESLRASHLAALGELAAGVAHEINNPTNGIVNYAQILANQSKEGSQEHDLAGRIIKEGIRIAGIVSNLLSFARNGKEEKGPVGIQKIVYASLALTETQLKKDGIRLMINVPSDLPNFIAHPQQIEQVFLNIISNARYALNQKYPGAHDNKVFEITAKKITADDSPHIQIIFYDRGIGIPPGILNKIMNPFFTTKPYNISTGLGLSISHGIITDHGGNIMADSIEGEFTKIIIELPVGK